MTECPGPLTVSVERLNIRYGQRLVAHLDRDHISDAQAAEVKRRIREALRLDWDIPIAIVTREWSFTVEDT